MSVHSSIDRLAHLPFFAREDLRVLPYAEKNVEIFLYRATKCGDIYRLKRGLYTTRAFVESIRASGEYSYYQEFLANVQVTPSYISTEYVLAKYELLSEAVTAITSLTPGRPTLINNKLGAFRYRNTANDKLSDFETLQRGRFQIKLASKLQALFDYLYLRKKVMRRISPTIIEDLRLNLHLLTTEEFAQLGQRISESRSTKLMRIFSYLEKSYVAG